MRVKIYRSNPHESVADAISRIHKQINTIEISRLVNQIEVYDLPKEIKKPKLKLVKK